MFHVQTNAQSVSGNWVIFETAMGTAVASYSDPDSVRNHLQSSGEAAVEIDGDGNGSLVVIPVEWIGDGERLIGSDRVLSRIGSDTRPVTVTLQSGLTIGFE